MRIIEQLVYKIQGDNSEFDKSIDKSETKVNKFGSVANKIFAGITVAAIAMSVKKLGELAIASATALDRVDKMSQKIGISRQAFQEWDFILSQSGASVDGLQMGVKTLSNAADEARKGTALYTEAFDRLGVSVTDVNGNMKDQETLFSEVFSALADMENQTERTALANKLLGRSATELSPAFNAGADAIEDMRSKAHELGLVMSDDLIDQGVILTDNIDKVKRAFGAWRTEALTPIIGVLVTVTDRMLGQRDRSKELFDSTTDLVSITGEYKRITSELKKPVDDLTESERALLEIQQKRLQLQINQAIIDLGKNYTSTKNELSQLEKDEQKYQSTIQKSLDVINKYTPAQREEIMNYQQTGRTVSETARKKAELLLAESNLESAQLGLLDTQSKLIQKNDEYNARIVQIAQSVRDEQVELSTLRNINSDFADEVEAQVKILNARDEAMRRAVETFETMKDASIAELQAMIDSIEANKKSIYSIHLLKLAKEELARRNEVLAEETKKASEAEQELADWHQEQARRARIAANEARDLSIATREGADASKEHSDWLTEQARRMRIMADAAREASFAIGDVKTSLEEWADENEKLISSIIKIGNASSSILGSLGNLYEAQHDARMQQIDEEMQAELKRLGLAEDTELESLQKRLDKAREANDAELVSELETDIARQKILDDYDEKKKKIQREAAERQKAIAIFEAIINTASGIAEAIPNPWLMAAASVAGGLQIAAIEAQPIPSFDVGSIRIPETTQAIVHKDEMILTAPQAEQARREGITIAPTKNGGNSINLVIYLDGKEIARNTIDNLNSGSVGTIKARVVK